MHNENQLLEKMPKLKSKKFNKRFFNLKYGIQKIFNRQQLNEKTESIVTPRIQEVNDGAGSSRDILNTIEYKPTYQDGIRFFLTLVCNECEKCAGGWSLPKSANFAMVLHTLTNGIKFKKLEKFFLGMLNFQEFRIKYKIQIL